MGQSDHVNSVITITPCKVNKKLMSKIDFQYQTDLLALSFTSVSYQKSILSIIFRMTLHTVFAITDVTCFNRSMALIMYVARYYASRSKFLVLHDNNWKKRNNFFLIFNGYIWESKKCRDFNVLVQIQILINVFHNKNISFLAW